MMDERLGSLYLSMDERLRSYITQSDWVYTHKCALYSQQNHSSSAAVHRTVFMTVTDRPVGVLQADLRAVRTLLCRVDIAFD